MLKKNCEICKHDFETSIHNQKYCSSTCLNKRNAIKNGRISSFNLPSGTVGTIGELKVAIDLMTKGYEVYKPLTPNCSGDLLVEKNKKFIKIEVRTGYKNNTGGSIQFSKNSVRSNIVAVVLHAKSSIEYFSFPELKNFIP